MSDIFPRRKGFSELAEEIANEIPDYEVPQAPTGALSVLREDRCRRNRDPDRGGEQDPCWHASDSTALNRRPGNSPMRSKHDREPELYAA